LLRESFPTLAEFLCVQMRDSELGRALSARNNRCRLQTACSSQVGHLCYFLEAALSPELASLRIRHIQIHLTTELAGARIQLFPKRNVFLLLIVQATRIAAMQERGIGKH